MSSDISTSLVQQYSSNVQALVQQKGSKLRDCVGIEFVRGKNAFIDQIGKVAAVQKTTRHADTPQSDTPHKRRRLSLATYHWADLIDNDDKIRMLKDPASDYANAAAWAMGRAMDEAIVEAAFGTAHTGETGATSVDLPSSQIIDADCDTKFTFDKLRQVKRLFDASDSPAENRYIVLTAAQLDDLLSETKVTSADFASAKALVRGELDTFMGFKFIQLNAKKADNSLILPAVTTTVAGEGENASPVTSVIGRSCLAFQSDGIKLGIGQDIVGRITERDDKCFATQVYYEMSIGATRMQEDLVVKINCKE